MSLDYFKRYFVMYFLIFPLNEQDGPVEILI